MSLLSPEEAHAISSFGYGAVALAVGIESIGIPFPGETTLMAAAVYAGATHHLSVILVVIAAASGSIIGDNIGYLLGREFGFRLLVRYGQYVRLTARRIKLGQYLFLKHGWKVVLFGRFMAVLLALAGFLAGTMQMRWFRFLVYNAVGAIIWASAYGFGPYFLGQQIHRLTSPVGVVISITSVILVAAWLFFLYRNEKALQAEAERALPGPLRVHRPSEELLLPC